MQSLHRFGNRHWCICK